MSGILIGQTVLLTGASRGIGAAIAEAVLKEGAIALLHYNSGSGESERLREAFGPDKVRLLQSDLSERNAASALWAKATANGERITGLINNAAVMLSSGVDDGEPKWASDWDKTLAVNLIAVADLCRHAILHFREQSGGSIVNIASRAGLRGDLPDSMHYAASKGGVIALTRSIAKGFAAENVLAYTVAPGWVSTDRVRPWLEGPENAFKTAEIPLGRPAEPSEVAETVVFLLSGRAPSLTGATIDINGASYFH